MTAPVLQSFVVSTRDEEITDLRARLDATRWPDQLPDAGWDLGTDVDYLRALCAHWADGFDFGTWQRRCNRFPQVRTVVDDVTVHAIVAESEAADATPLLLLHGWPGSVAEYFDVIEPLRARHHVVVASLPGYGFSGPTNRSGVGLLTIAATMVALMQRLGHERFYVAGGDWGAIVGSWIAARHREAVLGLHVTLMPATPTSGGDPMEGVSADETVALGRMRHFTATGTGYQMIQSTKPQSLAYGLTDSPAGLAGWIVEKFHAWSDCDGDITTAFSMDRLLENLSIYWFTGTINSSMRLYQEAMSSGNTPFPDRHIEVPTGHAVFPGEIYPCARVWAEHQFRIVRWEVMPRGGHFAAMEVPELYTSELLAFTSAVGAA
jgi:pimeloyl-ACP methyl ester carboxylesterase